jgi:hypothetical protein
LADAAPRDKERVTLYLDPATCEQLRVEKAVSRQTLSGIVEAILRDRYRNAPRKRRPSVPA